MAPYLIFFISYSFKLTIADTISRTPCIHVRKIDGFLIILLQDRMCIYFVTYIPSFKRIQNSSKWFLVEFVVGFILLSLLYATFHT